MVVRLRGGIGDRLRKDLVLSPEAYVLSPETASNGKLLTANHLLRVSAEDGNRAA